MSVRKGTRVVPCSYCTLEGAVIRHPDRVEHAVWPETQPCIGCLLDKNLRALKAQGFTTNHRRSDSWRTWRVFAWKPWTGEIPQMQDPDPEDFEDLQ